MDRSRMIGGCICLHLAPEHRGVWKVYLTTRPNEWSFWDGYALILKGDYPQCKAAFDAVREGL